MQKLELTWIGKGQEPIVEPRILLRDATKDYGDPATDNMLIHGEVIYTQMLRKRHSRRGYIAAPRANSMLKMAGNLGNMF